MTDIRDAVKDDKKVYLFMDGAKFHTSEETKQEMEALNIEPVINVAYRFEYNPLERLWG